MKIKIILSVMFSLLAFSFSTGAAEQVYFYHTDPTGTPLSMTDASGVQVWKADYKPFGEENSASVTPANNKRFVGKEKDTETGLSYFGARYEDAKTGRFIAVDPVGAVDSKNNKTNDQLLANPQRLNSYAYALNNPYKYVDPDGRDVALIVGLPKGKNIFGHVAAAVTGKGVYSSGTIEPFGSSLTDYLRNQSKYRDSVVYVIPTSKEQDYAFVEAFTSATSKGHSATGNNCADITGAGLKAAELIGPNAMTKFPGMLNSYMFRRANEGAVSTIININEGNTQWGQLDSHFKKFNPVMASE